MSNITAAATDAGGDLTTSAIYPNLHVQKIEDFTQAYFIGRQEIYRVQLEDIERQMASRLGCMALDCYAYYLVDRREAKGAGVWALRAAQQRKSNRNRTDFAVVAFEFFSASPSEASCVSTICVALEAGDVAVQDVMALFASHGGAHGYLRHIRALARDGGSSDGGSSDGRPRAPKKLPIVLDEEIAEQFTMLGGAPFWLQVIPNGGDFTASRLTPVTNSIAAAEPAE